MRKRAAAILLALCMALTLLPTAAFATEEGGAVAPVEQPTQQEEKQEGQQEQPEETEQAIRFVEGLDIRTISEQVMQALFRALAMRFEFSLAGITLPAQK